VLEEERGRNVECIRRTAKVNQGEVCQVKDVHLPVWGRGIGSGRGLCSVWFAVGLKGVEHDIVTNVWQLQRRNMVCTWEFASGIETIELNATFVPY
jgi:hypothetical protein